MTDKYWHFVVSFFLCLMFGFMFAMSVGVLKELLFDNYLDGGCADIEDIYADWYGCILGALVRPMIGL